MTRRVADMVVAHGFSASNYWIGVNGSDEPVGSASMTRIAVLRRFHDGATDAAHVWSHTNNLVNGGWYITATATGVFNFGVSENGAVALTVSSSFDMDVTLDRLLIVCASYDGVNALIRVNGVADTQAAAAGGYTVPIASRELAVGIRSQTLDLPASQFGIAALLASDTTALDANGLLAAEAQLQDDLRNGRDLRAALATADLDYYDARDVQQGLGGTKDWAPRVGTALTYTKTGNLYTASYPGRP